MIYTLTLNPSMDLYIKSDSPVNTGLNRCASQKLKAGGKGINVSYVIKTLSDLGYLKTNPLTSDVKTTALGFIAGNIGDFFASEINKDGLSSNFIRLDSGNTRINTKITSSDSEYEINGAGPFVSSSDIDRLKSVLSSLSSSDFLIISGSFPPGFDVNDLTDILSLLNEHGISFAADIAGKYLSYVLPFKPLVVKPNLSELEEFLGVKISPEDIDEIYKASLELKAKGAQNVIVSLGADGALLLDDNSELYLESARKSDRTVSSTVGAGDSLLAGFIYALSKGLSSQESFRFGNDVAAAAVFGGGPSELLTEMIKK